MNKTLAYPLTKISQICIGTAYRRSHRTIRNAIKNQLVRAQGSIKPAHNHRNARPQTPQKVRSRTRHERQGIPTKSLLQRTEARIAREAGQRDQNGRGQEHHQEKEKPTQNPQWSTARLARPILRARDPSRPHPVNPSYGSPRTQPAPGDEQYSTNPTTAAAARGREGERQWRAGAGGRTSEGEKRTEERRSMARRRGGEAEAEAAAQRGTEVWGGGVSGAASDLSTKRDALQLIPTGTLAGNGERR